MRFFRQFQHLLPNAEAWRIVLEKQLRQLFEGLTPNSEDAVEFVDLRYLDLLPQDTTQLEEWEAQFALSGTGTEQERRDLLDARWKAQGGQSPSYLQGVLQAAGFDVYIHEWWQWLATYKSESFVVTTQDTVPTGVAFDTNGTKMFVCGSFNAAIYEYDLSVPFDVTTSVFSQSFSVSGEDGTPEDVFFSPDGTSMFMVGAISSTVYRYTLTTGFDLSTASVAADSLDTSTEDTAPTGGRILSDGLTLFVVGANTDTVYEYGLTTAFDLSTATISTSLDISAEGSAIEGIEFSDGGRKMYIVRAGGADRVDEYNLQTGYTLSGGSYFGVLVDVSSEDTSPRGLAINNVNKLLFVAGDGTNSIYAYDMARSAKDPRDYTTQPLFGTTQSGDDGSASGFAIAECGEQPPDQKSTDSAVCNRFLINEPGYLVNENLTDKAPPPVPDDSDFWPYFLYWGGEKFPATADVPIARQAEFERLLLTLCPTQQWLVTLINFTGGGGGGGAFTYTFTFDLPA